MKHRDFDVIVIGGGHAGSEAADAAARTGARVALVTLKAEAIGVMSCNPAIGGLGKGHLVREIDALDGLMGRAADAAGIQFRLLNRRKGPAVQGPRTQADRKLYRKAVQLFLAERQGLEIIEGEVVDLILEGQKVTGVVLQDGAEVFAGAVVLTSGTFLRGVIHIGDERREGGRWGDAPSVRLAARIEAFGLPLGRLKTGTPPRLDGRTIAWDRLESQPGDRDPEMLSFLSSRPAVRQVACGITHTNERTHELIRDNLDRSAMYGGHIEGVGPRYCPSIEDKVVRFSDKASHQVFLEPEGLDDHTVYPNGISTSLPRDVQEQYVHSIAGLESARILQPGYAIEYDYVDPKALLPSLAVRDVPGLYFAGQINGTTGYEEAGAQGLVAGLNAARFSKGLEPLHLSRSLSYIGVMIDDLVTRGVREPYRMFTSRAEYRLSLRADNADQRLTPFGLSAGCVGGLRARAFELKMNRLKSANERLDQQTFSSSELRRHAFDVKEDGKRRSLLDLLAFPDVQFADLLRLAPEIADIDAVTQVQVARDALYAQYLDRQKRDIDAVTRDEARKIPADFDFRGISGLSNELREKLGNIRPISLGQASRIEGMTPAAVTLLLAKLRQQERSKTA